MEHKEEILFKSKLLVDKDKSCYLFSTQPAVESFNTALRWYVCTWRCGWLDRVEALAARCRSESPVQVVVRRLLLRWARGMVAISGLLLSKQSVQCPKSLFRFLLRQCRLLPSGPRQHYQHFVRQVTPVFTFLVQRPAAPIPPAAPPANHTHGAWLFVFTLEI